MADLFRREWLISIGNGLAALSLGVVTASRQRDRQPTRASDGSQRSDQQVTETRSDRPEQSLEFERDENGDVEFDHAGVSFETRAGTAEFTVEANPSIDFEFESDEIELAIVVSTEAIDFEYEGNGDVDFEATGTGSDSEFENEDDEVEYEGSVIDFEWSIDDGLEVDIGDDVRFEFTGDEFEWDGRGFSFEWDAEANEFEVTRSPTAATGGEATVNKSVPSPSLQDVSETPVPTMTTLTPLEMSQLS
ncbi:hypothetical protein C499_06905 [Halogeometricum borinquense DSM 11551]|uniref:Uncharacterized protein n=2 Tax=Halogeometricum borinquense TaxID=60847 RepID=E4NVP5_HALBP|nr:hypothetical protein [Halogeometricum borinquense]ADQ68929.1 hypothetical protein Hbor_34070 [Halogeometricum borinquense DSM 11551]ELY28941.1 hypothetical protein C499_06905 [Halogeometricum borinquense DSM 11551]RYJ08124.1 hypothetical protein ELS19_16230 [Halogeometricum borinquense]